MTKEDHGIAKIAKVYIGHFHPFCHYRHDENNNSDETLYGLQLTGSGSGEIIY